MKILKIILYVLGGLFALSGLIWMGQGSGVFPYPATSPMIDQSPWILRGAGLALVGLAVIYTARRFIK
jgi:hypothetical protein